MSKKITNNYDFMKHALDITRKVQKDNYDQRIADFNKKLLKEEVKRTLTPEEYQQEIEKFKESVTTAIQFEQDPSSFQITEDNIQWGGNLVRENISFVFSLEGTDSLYITNLDMIQLTDETLETLNKLKAYYISFSEYWGGEISR